MWKASIYLFLSLSSASLSTVEKFDGSPIEAEQEARILRYLFCWVLLVGAALVIVTFAKSRNLEEVQTSELMEPLLPSHFYPCKSDCYYAAPKRGDMQIILNL